MSLMAQQTGACPRCHGYMVPVDVDGSEGVRLEWREWPGWRCVNCGEWIDPMILANRRAAESQVRIQHMHHNQGGHHG